MANHTELIAKIDNIIQNLWSGGVNNPVDYIEQISYFIFLKLLDEKEEEREAIARMQNKTYDGIFKGDKEKYKFRNWAHNLNGDELRLFIESDIFPFIRNLSVLKQEEREFFKNAHLKIYEPSTLKAVVESIANLDFSKFDFIDKGDLYEYMLSKISKSGTNGQFRTPRNVIDMMVKLADPDVMETIYDPACGTAGFLIGTYNHILTKHSHNNTLIEKTDGRGEKYNLGTGDLLNDNQRDFLYTKTFYGYDIDINMVRFSIMNMILHGFSEGTSIRIKDVLGKNKDEIEEGRSYDVILANPPFAGSIAKDRIDKLDFPVFSSATEVLFLGHMINKLNKGGRCVVIVPEGMVFKTNNDYVNIRKHLVEKCSLNAVISLPSGIFQPYSGVKTNILIFTKGKPTEKVWFYDLQNDGYDLGAQRRPIKTNDIPDLLERYEYLKHYNGNNILEDEKLNSKNAWFASIEDIAKNEYILSAGRYKKSIIKDGIQAFPRIKLGEICELRRGLVYSKDDELDSENGIKVLRANNINVKNSNLNLTDIKTINISVGGDEKKKLHKDDIFICLASGSKEHIGKIAYIDINTEYYFGGFMGAIVANDKVLPKYLFNLLRGEYFNTYLRNTISGANINNLNSKILYNFEIPLPPLVIQQEIIDKINEKQEIINKANELIEATERERGNFEEYIEGLDVEWVELNELCNTEYGIGLAGLDDGELRYVRITDIDENGLLKNKDFKYIPLNEETKTYILNKGDILVARTGATYGKTLYFNSDIRSAFAGFLIRLNIDNSKLLNKYYFFYSFSDKYEEQKKELVSGGGQPQFNANAIKQIKVPIISIEKQKEIIEQLETQEELIVKLKKVRDNKQEDIDRIINKLF
ncbi:MAG: N-6 DNA methylase [Candidatus Gracilibacteria bacterium]|nr:N-6 DNA methylase [Candidatus Gracilibacteria bacterium]